MIAVKTIIGAAVTLARPAGKRTYVTRLRVSPSVLADVNMLLLKRSGSICNTMPCPMPRHVPCLAMPCHAMPHATRHMPHATCHMPHATCHMPHATCHMPRATCHMPHAMPHACHATCMPCHMPHAMPHATCHHATCRMPHAACRMPHAACRMPHATCHMPYACHAMPGEDVIREAERQHLWCTMHLLRRGRACLDGGK